LHGVHSASEIGKNAIARRAENPATVRGDQAINDDSVCSQRAERPDLIPPHQPTVALDIGCEDRGELPFDGLGFHVSAPPQPKV
jgi:hypothetical protein